MLLWVTVAVFVLLLAGVAGGGYYVWVADSEGSAAATTALPAAGWELPDEDAEIGGIGGFLAQVGGMLPAKAGEREIIREELASAGFRDARHVEAYNGARWVAMIGLPLATLVVTALFDADLVMLITACAFAAAVGHGLPDRYLRKKRKSRRKAIHQGLPDFLDLLVVSLDSGLVLEQGIADTARDLESAHPVICEELRAFQNESFAGATREDALRNLAKRTGEKEMKKLTSLLIQADRFGASVSKVLRTQATYMRLRRRQAAEEMAHKVGVKLIFPIFFLIMPSMFLVTAGPALLQLFGSLGRMTP